jgi:hypothetical protein
LCVSVYFLLLVYSRMYLKQFSRDRKKQHVEETTYVYAYSVRSCGKEVFHNFLQNRLGRRGRTCRQQYYEMILLTQISNGLFFFTEVTFYFQVASVVLLRAIPPIYSLPMVISLRDTLTATATTTTTSAEHNVLSLALFRI